MKAFTEETLAYYGYEYDDEGNLKHYGVPGMHWGQRRARNPNYTDQQRKRDIQVYGRRGANRINKNLNKGDKISVARGTEKGRRDRVMGKNKYVRQGGKIAGAIAGVAIGNVGLSLATRAASSGVGRGFIDKFFGSGAGSKAAFAMQTLSNNPAIRVVVSAGAAKVGTLFAGDAAVAANMRLHGYDPNRK